MKTVVASVHEQWDLRSSLGQDDVRERDDGHFHLGTEPLRVPDGVHHARCVPGGVRRRPRPSGAWRVLVPRAHSREFNSSQLDYEFM